MKMILRFTIKTIATPFFIIWIVPLLIIGYCAIFWDWLYEKSDFEKSITQDVHAGFIKEAKTWFTSI